MLEFSKQPLLGYRHLEAFKLRRTSRYALPEWSMRGGVELSLGTMQHTPLARFTVDIRRHQAGEIQRHFGKEYRAFGHRREMARTFD
jgi:hypothetical protein